MELSRMKESVAVIVGFDYWERASENEEEWTGTGETMELLSHKCSWQLLILISEYSQHSLVIELLDCFDVTLHMRLGVNCIRLGF